VIRVAALTGALLALLLPTSPSFASSSQESILMDDPELVYSSPDRLESRLSELRAMGVDRIRVSVYWDLIAPSPDAKSRPDFGSAGPDSPAGYPSRKWDRYDLIVVLAKKHGVGVQFSVTAPAPLWATGSPQRKDIEETYDPDPREFRDFVTALGKRYSGSYRDERPDRERQPPEPEPSPIPPIPPIPPPPVGESDGSSSAVGPVLPRVDFWSIWNEPNHPGWLTPQWHPNPEGGRMVAVSPRVYRRLFDSAWAALQATGHGQDTILVGETSPRGARDRGLTKAVRPLEFIRELYCLSRRLRPYRGGQARARGCPDTDAARSSFASDHPGLFQATGWAHHPYAFETPPRRHDRVRDNVVLIDLRRLTKTLDRALARHGRPRQLPIYVTEYGYQTKPPDPTVGVSWARQAAYLAEGDYLAFRNPRVAAMTQFLLVDDGPLRQFPSDDPRYWGTFQTGLVTHEGRRKLAYEAYKRPLYVGPRRTRRGRRFRVFGQLRTAANGASLTVDLQFRRRGNPAYETIQTATTNNARGFVFMSAPARRSGAFRLAWHAGGRTEYSRPVSVRVRR
jgi:hypothetical protein